MARKFEIVKKWYRAGLWTEEMVRNAIAKGWITAAQCEEILGKDEGTEN